MGDVRLQELWSRSAVTEYRACAGDRGSTSPDACPWSADPTEALAQYETAHDSTPPYDDIWLETRIVSEPERVPEASLASMLETFRGDQLKWRARWRRA